MAWKLIQLEAIHLACGTESEKRWLSLIGSGVQGCKAMTGDEAVRQAVDD